MKSEWAKETLNIVGGIVVLFVFGLIAYCLWALVNKPLPPGNESTVIQVVGGLNALAGLIVGFFFGSSQQSKKQSETVDKLAETTKQAQAVALPSIPTPTLKVSDGETITVEGRSDASGN